MKIRKIVALPYNPRIKSNKMSPHRSIVNRKVEEPFDASNSTYLIFDIKDDGARNCFIRECSALFCEYEILVENSVFRFNVSDIDSAIVEIVKESKLNPETDRVYMIDMRVNTSSDNETFSIADHLLFPGKIQNLDFKTDL